MKRLVVSLAVGLFVMACSRDASPAARPSSSTSPSKALVDSTSSSQRVSAASALDLQSVSWTTIQAPGEACLTSQPIQLRDETEFDGKHYGTALIPDEQHGYPDPPGAASGPKYDRLTYLGDVAFGDFTGDGQDDAVVPLNCNNNGGTADGALLYSLALYIGGDGTIQYVGLITPKQQPADQLPTLLTAQTITPGSVLVDEEWYGPHDPTCCPTGRAVTSWAYGEGHIHASSTNVTTQPASS